VPGTPSATALPLDKTNYAASGGDGPLTVERSSDRNQTEASSKYGEMALTPRLGPEAAHLKKFIGVGIDHCEMFLHHRAPRVGYTLEPRMRLPTQNDNNGVAARMSGLMSFLLCPSLSPAFVSAFQALQRNSGHRNGLRLAVPPASARVTQPNNVTSSRTCLGILPAGSW
jgi:hypothetical protein